MFQLMKIKPEIRPSEMAKTLLLTKEDTDITFESVSFEYVQGQKILDELSFTVPAGKRIAIVGGSGSGKSTLIRLLYRFYEPNSGSIKIAGHNIYDIDLECLRKHIAIVPQDSVLFHNTIHHNISYGNLNAAEEEVITAAQMAEIHNSILVS
jgi:ATP-binding cassette subfamily B (MDR/TAP) protein 7